MGEYVLDRIPRFCSGSVTIEGTTYNLRIVDGSGAILLISKGGIPQEEITLSKADLKGIYALLNSH